MKKSAIFIASATISILLTGWTIIVHDLSSDFKELIATFTGHHWTSVSLLTIVLFILCSGFLLGSESVRKSLRMNDIKLWSTALVTVTLLMILGVFAELITRYLAE